MRIHQLVIKTEPFFDSNKIIEIRHPLDLRDTKSYNYIKGSLTRYLNNRDYESFINKAIILVEYED